MSTSIRLSEEAKSRLDLHKREDESYDDVIMRLTADDKWGGFGIASSEPADSREGLKEVHEQLRGRMDDRIEDGDK